MKCIWVQEFLLDVEKNYNGICKKKSICNNKCTGIFLCTFFQQKFVILVQSWRVTARFIYRLQVKQIKKATRS